MRLPRRRIFALLLPCLVALLVCRLATMKWRRGAEPPLPLLARAFPARMPARVVWAWEELEDLSTLSPNVGVAYLAETIRIRSRNEPGLKVTLLPRRQPLQTAPGARVMPVVRIEAVPDAPTTSELSSALARHLAQLAAQQSSLGGLQVDFDAVASQQPFYAELLQQLRAGLPAGLPLSITALASWCGPHTWLSNLPLGTIDEAVPMLFRMGGPRALAQSSRPAPSLTPITEPLCRTSLGLSTDEPWPAAARSNDQIASRIYLFAPSAWQPKQLASVATAPLHSLSEELLTGDP